MKNLRKHFEYFCYQHRNWGIPNLMLYVALGNALVWVLSMFKGGDVLFTALCFNKTLILQGQVWRLFTYIFTDVGNGVLGLLFLYFFYNLGRHVELSMGTFRFNLFYFTGVVLMDVYAMIFFPGNQLYYLDLAFYLHLSLILLFAATYPDSQFMIFFIIPVRAWLLALVYLVMILTEIFQNPFPMNLFPLVGLGNFLLFTGRDVLNLLPPSMRPSGYRKVRVSKPKKKTGTIPFPGAAGTSPAYTHKCTVCGRTDVTNPELEFRYCSKCSGYACYCQDHINNHPHIQ